MSLLTPITKWVGERVDNILWSVVKYLLEYLKGRALREGNLKDANTPEDVRAAWNNYITEQLRDKTGSSS